MKIAEFRANLKGAFDEALKGNAVIIERGGVVYKLVADVTVFREPKVVANFTPDPVYISDSQEPGDPSEQKPPKSGLESLQNKKSAPQKVIDDWTGPMYRKKGKI